MKRLIVLFLCVLLIAPAYADGRHGHGGWDHNRGWGWGDNWLIPAIIGGAVIYDITRPQTVYVQPTPVYVQPETVYIQQTAPPYSSSYAPSAAPQSAGFWYFCGAANAYYPYVTSCPGGWQTVPATPPPPPANMSSAPDMSR